MLIEPNSTERYVKERRSQFANPARQLVHVWSTYGHYDALPESVWQLAHACEALQCEQ